MVHGNGDDASIVTDCGADWEYVQEDPSEGTGFWRYPILHGRILCNPFLTFSSYFSTINPVTWVSQCKSDFFVETRRWIGTGLYPVPLSVST